MAEKEYIIFYSGDARKRHRHETLKGKVVKFIVQLEIKHEGGWKEVVRYDCAHGYAHRDSYNLRGQYGKEKLSLEFEDALCFADDDIDDNWEVYKREFLKGGSP